MYVCMYKYMYKSNNKKMYLPFDLPLQGWPVLFNTITNFYVLLELCTGKHCRYIFLNATVIPGD